MLKNVEKFKNYIREIELKNNKKRAKKTQKQYDYTKQKLNVCYDETVELIKKIKRHVNKMANKTIKNRDYKIILDGMNSFDEVLNFNQDEHDAKIKKIHKDYIRRKRQHHTLKNV
jgi:ferritin